MADFSQLQLSENINKMRDVKALIGNRNVLIEGELGQVAGVEDGHGEEGGTFVRLEDVRQFVAETETDLLAVGIGNAHGFYDTTDKIDIDLLREVHLSVPNQQLVLHGGTGIEDEKIRQMIKLGVHKINISTELKHRYITATEDFLRGDDKLNMMKLVQCRYDAVRLLAEAKIRQFRKG
jgi:fructose/tagatose bisphosphate aldolase